MQSPEEAPVRARLSVDVVRKVLLRFLILVSAGGLAAEVGKHMNGGERPFWSQMLSLSYEENFPTWYSVFIIVLCSGLLAAIGWLVKRPGTRVHLYWWALSLIFAYISFDEMISIHEHAHRFVETGGGILYFDWIVPAAIVVGIVGLAYIPFLWRLPKSTRTQFIVAGTIYVVGAMVLELPLGWWKDHYGSDTLGYGLIDFIEETMEILGMTLFCCALLEYFGARFGGLAEQG